MNKLISNLIEFIKLIFKMCKDILIFKPSIALSQQKANEFISNFNSYVTGYNFIESGKISISSLVDYYSNNVGNHTGFRIYNVFESIGGIFTIKHILSIGDSKPRGKDTYNGPVLLLNNSGQSTELRNSTYIKKLISDFSTNITINQLGLKKSTSSWYSWIEFEKFLNANHRTRNEIDIFFRFEFGLNKSDFASKYHGICTIIYLEDEHGNRLDTNTSATYDDGRFDVGDPCPNNCGFYDPAI